MLLACKGLRKVTYFLLQIFALLYSYTIVKRVFNVLRDQNKNYIHNWSILVKEKIF
jgi:hypothetical protein